MLDPAFFAGRRVLIVGPARGARDELRSLVGVRFDIVVRMNNGIALAGDGPFPGTDILFHNFKEEGERSAGLLVRSVLDGAGVRYLVFTHPAESRGWQLLKARLRVTRLGCTAALRIPPPDWYAGLSRRFGRWEPTTGSVAIALVLAGAPKCVAIVGFTFFGSAYEAGYNNQVRDETAEAWARALGSHDPDVDRAQLRRLIQEVVAAGVEIDLGTAVAATLDLDSDGRAPSL